MSSSVELCLDWCSHQAAKHAVEHWHYSGSLPPPPMRRIGVWETGRFVGCVLFARGASSNLLKPYGLKMTEGCELVRVALRDHWTPVSRIVAIALKILGRAEPGLRLVLSFADPAQGHHGGIYQAGGWLYLGTTASTYMYRDRAGKVWHNRMVSGERLADRLRQATPRAEDQPVRTDRDARQASVRDAAGQDDPAAAGAFGSTVPQTRRKCCWWHA